MDMVSVSGEEGTLSLSFVFTTQKHFSPTTSRAACLNKSTVETTVVIFLFKCNENHLVVLFRVINYYQIPIELLEKDRKR